MFKAQYKKNGYERRRRCGKIDRCIRLTNEKRKKHRNVHISSARLQKSIRNELINR